MKKVYYSLTLLSSLLLILSCCKDKEKAPDPVATASISYSPIVSWTKAGQVPVIYEGDTVKYNIAATATADITALNVYKIDITTGTKTLLPSYPKTTFADKRSITDQVYVPVGAKADFKPFYLSIETIEGTPVTTLTTNKYITLSELSVQNDLRLAFKGQSFSQLNSYYMSDNAQTGSYALILADNLNKFKINGIRTYLSGSGSNIVIKNHSSYVKVGAFNFDDLKTPDEIKSYYVLLKANAKYILDLDVNEYALCKLNQDDDTLNHLPTYGFIKITSIYDDGLQGSVDGSYANDYLYYSIKLFNPYRFK